MFPSHDRAATQGRGQGASIDEALQLYASGSTISDEDLKEYIQELKKKDPAELTSRDQRDASDSVSELDQQNTLSVSLPDVPEGPQSTVGQDVPRFQSDEEIRIARANQAEISRRQEESRKVGQRYGVYKRAQKEKDTWLEEMLGKNFATDFFGNMWRAAMQGS